MAHYEKYNRAATGHMLQHYDRTRGSSTSEIDPERTQLNYNLIDHGNQLDYLHQRLGEVRLSKRKDVNVLCDWIVTLPADVPADRQEEFFRKTADFLQEKYGEVNTVSAWVHLDETTPHLHYAFIPVVPDPKHDGLKVSAKECVTRADLQHFHEELQQYLEAHMGIPVGIQNGLTAGGNVAIADLKRGTALQEQDYLQSRINALQSDLASLEGRILTAEQIRAQTVHKPLLGRSDGSVKLPYSEYMDLRATAAEVDRCKQLAADAQQVLDKKEEIWEQAQERAYQLVYEAQTEAGREERAAKRKCEEMQRKAQLDRKDAAAVLQQAQQDADRIKAAALDAAEQQRQELLGDVNQIKADLDRQKKRYSRVFAAFPELQVAFEQAERQLKMQQKRVKRL